MNGKVSLKICGNGACVTHGCKALISSWYYQQVPFYVY